jgi:hypothetical protein
LRLVGGAEHHRVADDRDFRGDRGVDEHRHDSGAAATRRTDDGRTTAVITAEMPRIRMAAQ